MSGPVALILALRGAGTCSNTIDFPFSEEDRRRCIVSQPWSLPETNRASTSTRVILMASGRCSGGAERRRRSLRPGSGEEPGGLYYSSDYYPADKDQKGNNLKKVSEEQ
ncbi:hypothetical protein F2Q69_00034005 [Brassica cretica]|uniref:Uncharacterized protein n=1 Tax=Brassica cretica TaxID=69181 RepID=A0A8S9SME7_BRACR|nr:hypothetical protein F2Q69_00034005 [Brassica cretica]